MSFPRAAKVRRWNSKLRRALKKKERRVIDEMTLCDAWFCAPCCWINNTYYCHVCGRAEEKKT